MAERVVGHGSFGVVFQVSISVVHCLKLVQPCQCSTHVSQKNILTGCCACAGAQVWIRH